MQPLRPILTSRFATFRRRRTSVSAQRVLFRLHPEPEPAPPGSHRSAPVMARSKARGTTAQWRPRPDMHPRRRLAERWSSRPVPGAKRRRPRSQKSLSRRSGRKPARGAASMRPFWRWTRAVSSRGNSVTCTFGRRAGYQERGPSQFIIVVRRVRPSGSDASGPGPPLHGLSFISGRTPCPHSTPERSTGPLQRV